ncbi:hypothetical protein PFISCL1PPCAC_25059, partial [Pristionchus fissidentatus]
VLVSRASSIIIYVSMALATVTVPLATVSLRVLFRDHPCSTMSFYTIYKVGLVIDIIALLITNVVCVIPTRGWALSREVMETQTYLKLFYCANYAVHVCQGFTNVWLCMNRTTAVLLPVLHHKIWDNRIVLACCFAIQLTAGVIMAERTTCLHLYLMRYPTGELFPMTIDSSALRAYWTRSFLANLTSLSVMLVLYGIVVWRFCAKFLHFVRSDRYNDI